MNLFDEFKARGMIAQCTNEEEVRKLFEGDEKFTFYIGFDPTADSLHIGHFIQLKIMAHMQKAGHKPIAIFGGGTAMVGDPSGKNDMRKMMTKETIAHNVECFKQQMSKFIDVSDGKALFINNADWLLDMNYIDYIREVGPYFTISRMLAAECYKSRLEKGLTFLEFNYMTMQSYDFYRLFCDYGCTLEFGGDDQWSNIIGGIELVRKVKGEEVCGMTFALLTTSDGKKMGKTMGGAVWLDPKKTSPYDFYQYWRNTEDASVIKCLKFLTFIPVEEIEAMESWQGTSKINDAKEILAYEVTKIVHGEEEATKARDAARAIFGAGVASADMPSTTLSDELFTDGKAEVTSIMVACGLCKSKGEARRLIDQGGVSIDDVKVTDGFAAVDKEAFSENGFIVIKKGKKVYHKALIG